MTMTDRPIPAALALPGQDEPLNDEEIEQGLATWEPTYALPGVEDDPEDLREELRPVARFAVTDDGLAEWAIRKLAADQAETSEIEAQAAGWIEEIQRWRAERMRPLEARRAFFEGHLKAYMATLRAADPKVKSRKLPSGTLRSTSSAAAVAVGDEDALIAWAEDHLADDELAAVVKITKKALVSGLKEIGTVSEVKVGERWHASLSCGHLLIGWLPETPEAGERPLPPPSVGEVVTCENCEPEFGENPRQTVEQVERVEILEPVVRDEDTGALIPGAVVRPASVSYSVKVGG